MHDNQSSRTKGVANDCSIIVDFWETDFYSACTQLIKNDNTQ